MAAKGLEKVGKNATEVAKRGADGVVKDPKRLAVAGMAIAAAPVAAQGLSKLGLPKVANKVSDVGDRAKDKAKSQVQDTIKEATPDSPGELLGGGKGAFKGLFSGGDGDSEGRAAPGFGSGRRMPVQQSVDVAVPVSVAYNHWTRFEDWPKFMHRIERVEQVDDATVSFEAKIWGINKRFEADIIEQRPDERIEWNVTQGYAHTGLVTFHSLADNLTRIDLTLDVEPSNIIDKASRGGRWVKRAVRADLHRFKAYVELSEEHDDAEGWRGRIEDGRVKSRSRKRAGGGGSSRSRNGSSRKSSSRKNSSRKKSAAKS